MKTSSCRVDVQVSGKRGPALTPQRVRGEKASSSVLARNARAHCYCWEDVSR